MSNLPDLKPGVSAKLADIIKPSKHAGIIYELRPNIKANFMNVQLKTNSQGWRGKLYPVYKDKNTVRVITIGDSHMFGWGVPEDKIYTNVLEGMLSSKFPENKWEVINTAVPGYNTYMEVETLKEKALIYKPDIVFMEYIGNDLDLPNFIMEQTDYLDFKKSFLLTYLEGRADLLKTNFFLTNAPLLKDPIIKSRFEHDPKKVPEKYRSMVGWDSFFRSMLKLKKMQKENGFDVFICISHNWPEGIPEKIIKLCNQLKFYVLFKPVSAEPQLILSPSDKHPNETQHKLIAEYMLNFMIKEKIIDRNIKK